MYDLFQIVEANEGYLTTRSLFFKTFNERVTLVSSPFSNCPRVGRESHIGRHWSSHKSDLSNLW